MRFVLLLVGVLSATSELGEVRAQGPFVPYPEPAPAGGAATSLLMADMDGDGRADILHSHIAGFSVSLTNRNGMPRPPAVIATTGGGLLAAATDLFGDGYADLLTRGASGGGVWLASNPGPTCVPGAPLAPALLSLPMPSGDTVVSVAASGGFPTGIAPVVHVLVNDALGTPQIRSFDLSGFGPSPTATLRPPSAIVLPAGASSVAVGDFNDDSLADVVVVGGLFSGAYAIFIDTGGALVANVAHPVVTPANLTSTPAIVGDFNGDGKDDIVAGGFSAMGVAMNLGVGPAGPTFAVATISGTNGFTPVAAGDFDGDGDLDVVCRGANTFRFLLNNGSGVFALSPTAHPYLGASSGLRVAAGDVDGDGDADLVVSFASPFSTEAFSLRLNEAVPTGPQSPGTGEGLDLFAAVPLAGRFPVFGVGPDFEARRAPSAPFDLWFAGIAPPVFAGDVYVVGVDLIVTGCSPPTLAPFVAMTDSFAILALGAFPASGPLPPVVLGPFPLGAAPTGLSGLAQFAVISPSAANGSFATSSAFELQW